jgi:hypothetical protein
VETNTFTVELKAELSENAPYLPKIHLYLGKHSFLELEIDKYAITDPAILELIALADFNLDQIIAWVEIWSSKKEPSTH